MLSAATDTVDAGMARSMPCSVTFILASPMVRAMPSGPWKSLTVPTSVDTSNDTVVSRSLISRVTVSVLITLVVGKAGLAGAPHYLPKNSRPR